MSKVAVPASLGEALAMLQASAGYLADLDAAGLPVPVLAQGLRGLGRADAVTAVAWARLLAAYDVTDGYLADGQRTLGAWLVHVLRVTRKQVREYKGLQGLARDHEPLLAGLREGDVITKPVALQLAQWTQAIPAEFRAEAEQILVAAARAGADLRALAAICAEIVSRTAPPDPDGRDPDLDRALFFDTTLDGAGVLRGDLTPQCAAMVQAVLDALAVPAGGGDLRTRPQRYHDALAEAMKRLLASDLLPQRAGQPVKALVHMSFAELCELDAGSVLQDKWIADYRARWAAQRAAASVSTGDGGAWLDGDAARKVACDAMIIPVVLGEVDPGAVEDLITLCVQYDRIRGHAAGCLPGPRGTDSRDGSTGGAMIPAGPGGADTGAARSSPTAPAVTPAARSSRPGRAGRATPSRSRSRPGGRRPRCWPCWNTRSWPPSCRSSPVPAASPPSCAATCSARA